MSTAAIVIVALVAFIASYIAVSANITAEENERKLNEVLTMVDSKLISIEEDLRRMKNELTVNEQSHGVLSMQIQEISKLGKNEALRKEVLHTKGDL